MFQAHFLLLLSQPWNQSFLSGVLVPFSEEQYLEDNPMLVVFTAIGMSLFPGPLSEKARGRVWG